MRWLVFISLFPSILIAGNDEPAQFSRSTSIVVRSAIGWSENYNMTYGRTYRKDGLANCQSVSTHVGFQTSEHCMWHIGLKYSRIAFWCSYVDSSYYDVTGLLTYKDTRYSRNVGVVPIGVSFPLRFGKNGIEPEIGISYSILSRFYVTDDISNERVRTYAGTKSRGLNGEASFSYSRYIGDNMKMNLGISCAWIHDKIVIRGQDHNNDSYVKFNGVFYSLAVSFCYQL